MAADKKESRRMAADKTAPEWGTPEWVEQYMLEHGHPPIAGGDDGEEDGSGDGEGDGAAAGGDGGDTGDGDGSGDGDDGDESGDGDDGDDSNIDWKAMARKHEREAKKARKEAEKAAADLKKRQDAEKSEHEKEIDKAREEGKNEATQASRQQLLKAKIEAAATGKLEYPEDAPDLLKLKVEDVFDDDGEIDTEAIKGAIAELLKNKPKLAAGQASGSGGGNDAGRGSGGSSSLEEMSAEDFFEAGRRTKSEK